MFTRQAEAAQHSANNAEFSIFHAACGQGLGSFIAMGMTQNDDRDRKNGSVFLQTSNISICVQISFPALCEWGIRLVAEQGTKAVLLMGMVFF